MSYVKGLSISVIWLFLHHCQGLRSLLMLKEAHIIQEYICTWSEISWTTYRKMNDLASYLRSLFWIIFSLAWYNVVALTRAGTSFYLLTSACTCIIYILFIILMFRDNGRLWRNRIIAIHHFTTRFGSIIFYRPRLSFNLKWWRLLWNIIIWHNII